MQIIIKELVIDIKPEEITALKAGDVCFECKIDETADADNDDEEIPGISDQLLNQIAEGLAKTLQPLLALKIDNHKTLS